MEFKNGNEFIDEANLFGEKIIDLYTEKYGDEIDYGFMGLTIFTLLATLLDHDNESSKIFLNEAAKIVKQRFKEHS